MPEYHVIACYKLSFFLVPITYEINYRNKEGSQTTTEAGTDEARPKDLKMEVIGNRAIVKITVLFVETDSSIVLTFLVLSIANI